MRKQLLFCVETNNGALTDYVYIKETIMRFYVNDPKIRYVPIPMNGKMNYDKKEKEIKKHTRLFKGETIVILFIDVDNYDSSPEDAERLRKIRAYCKKMGFEMVFFTKDVEDVFWGHKISVKMKTKESARFRSSKKINDIKEKQLMSERIEQHKSNILLVLDGHFSRKKIMLIE